MLVRWILAFVLPLGFLFPLLLHAKYTFDPRQHKGMEATLTVEASKQTAERGLGEVTLTLTVVGPTTLDVEEPRLGDAAAAWKEDRLASSRMIESQRARWSQVIVLKQVKRGIEPVPDVTVRFRQGADAEWVEEKWIDILRYLQDGTQVLQPAEEEPSWLRRWGFVLIMSATLLLVILVWLKKRRRTPLEAPLPTDRWALREMDRIERTLLPPQGGVEVYHTQISFVVRRYLADRLGLPALNQTTAEFLDAICQVPQLSAEVQALLRELFERCDLAKFANAGASPEECQHTVGLARNLVQQTSK